MRSPLRACARASVQPHSRPYTSMPSGGHLLDLGRRLPVLELAHVEVAALAVESLDRAPSRGRCRWRPASGAGRRRPAGRDWRYSLAPRNGSSTDASASLICRNSGSLPSRPISSPIHARVPTLPTPTTLRAKSTQMELLEQDRRSDCSDSRYTRISIRSSSHQPLWRRTGRSFSIGTISGGSVDDLHLAVDHLGQLRERRHAVARAGLRQRLLGALDLRWLELRRSTPRAVARCRGARTTPRGCSSRRTRASRCGRRRPSSSTTAACSLVGEAVVARGDQHAGRQPLDVPLPGARQRLVEVVDVEHQPPLGRGEHAEVRQVRVAAALNHADRSAAWRRGRAP